eukprot:GHVU01180473.1.p1 GENE.GHVU01180473.1~~GHVU01180473.1.p1  ORF type:complete len:149 (+),score=23.89 GHVU01180473.1:41-448(+)
MSSAAKTVNAVRSSNVPAEEGAEGELDSAATNARAINMEAAMPAILDTMLRFNVLDIQDTVKAAVMKVVSDMSVPEDTLIERAKAILELGVLFQEVTSKEIKDRKGAEFDARNHMEKALLQAHIAARAQDDAETI